MFREKKDESPHPVQEVLAYCLLWWCVCIAWVRFRWRIGSFARMIIKGNLLFKNCLWRAGTTFAFLALDIDIFIRQPSLWPLISLSLSFFGISHNHCAKLYWYYPVWKRKSVVLNKSIILALSCEVTKQHENVVQSELSQCLSHFSIALSSFPLLTTFPYWVRLQPRTWHKGSFFFLSFFWNGFNVKVVLTCFKCAI